MTYEEKYFAFPFSELKDVPLYDDRKKIIFNLVEIGCQQTKKRSQLRDHKEAIIQFWNQYYKPITNWTPQVNKIMAHFENRDSIAGNNELKADKILRFNNINSEILSKISLRDKQPLYATFGRGKKNRKILENIFENYDADEFKNLIYIQKHNQTLDYLRGRVAEIIVQHSIGQALPENTQFYRNPRLNYITERYDSGLEIDGIIITYGTKPFKELINNLTQEKHIFVKEDIVGKCYRIQQENTK